MDLNKSFKKAIDAYWQDKEPKRLKKEMKGSMKFDKKGMSSMEEDLLGDTTELDSWTGEPKK